MSHSRSEADFDVDPDSDDSHTGVHPMKLYTYPQAPSPRRIHLFLAAKGAEVEQVEVDLRAGEHQQVDFAARNRSCTVPVLQLDNGTCLSESVAICRYLEDIFPDPPLMGQNPEQRARIADLDHWVEMNGLLAVMEAFRNANPAMKDRALPGPRPVAQIPELAERGRQRFQWFLEDFDAILEDSQFAAGEEFSVADITALITVQFAQRAIKAEIPESMERVARWHRRVTDLPFMQTVD